MMFCATRWTPPSFTILVHSVLPSCHQWTTACERTYQQPLAPPRYLDVTQGVCKSDPLASCIFIDVCQSLTFNSATPAHVSGFQGKLPLILGCQQPHWEEAAPGHFSGWTECGGVYVIQRKNDRSTENLKRKRCPICISLGSKHQPFIQY